MAWRATVPIIILRASLIPRPAIRLSLRLLLHSQHLGHLPLVISSTRAILTIGVRWCTVATVILITAVEEMIITVSTIGKTWLVDVCARLSPRLRPGGILSGYFLQHVAALKIS